MDGHVCEVPLCATQRCQGDAGAADCAFVYHVAGVRSEQAFLFCLHVWTERTIVLYICIYVYIYKERESVRAGEKKQRDREREEKERNRRFSRYE